MSQILNDIGISKGLINEVNNFREKYKVDKKVIKRIPKAQYRYYSKDVWEMAITAILNGDNLLLNGIKSTGKNILAENLAEIFNRPEWTVSFHASTDSSTLIGTDTFKNNEVVFSKGSIYKCSLYGGFGILDEINMARNDSVAVLFSILDFRRKLDIPRYDVINIHDATRFIATINHGYLGTKELNEALVSRFMVIDMPLADREILTKIILDDFSDIKKEGLKIILDCFFDLQKKAINGEITDKSIDIRALISAINAIYRGLNPKLSFDMALTGKVFDKFEKTIVDDTVSLSISNKMDRSNFF